MSRTRDKYTRLKLPKVSYLPGRDSHLHPSIGQPGRELLELGKVQLGLEERRKVVPILLPGGRTGPSNGHWDRAELGEGHNSRERSWYSIESLEDLEKTG